MKEYAITYQYGIYRARVRDPQSGSAWTEFESAAMQEVLDYISVETNAPVVLRVVTPEAM